MQLKKIFIFKMGSVFLLRSGRKGAKGGGRPDSRALLPRNQNAHDRVRGVSSLLMTAGIQGAEKG